VRHNVNINKSVTSNVDNFSVCCSIALRNVSTAGILIAVSNEVSHVSHACVVCREPGEPCEVRFLTSALRVSQSPKSHSKIPTTTIQRVYIYYFCFINYHGNHIITNYEQNIEKIQIKKRVMGFLKFDIITPDYR